MLKQSKALPIVLRSIVFVQDGSPEAKKIVTRNLHRIRSLELTFKSCEGQEVAQWIWKVLAPDTAPALKTLELAIIGDSHIYHIMTFPDTTLSSLTIRNFCPEFLGHRAQETLTSFYIALPSMVNHTERTRAYLRRTLSKMPNLTYLHITHSSGALGFTPDSGSRVSLPHLETLRCSSTVLDCLLILDVLQLPPTAHLDLHIQDHRDAPVDLLFTALSQILRGRQDIRSETAMTTYDVHFITTYISHPSHSTTHRALVFESDPDSHTHTETSSWPLSKRPAPDRLPVLSLSKSGYTPDPRYLSLLFNILNIPSRCSVTSLHMQLNTVYDIDSQIFTNNFDQNGGLLPELSFLTCSGVKSLYIGDLGSAECVAPFFRPRKTSTVGAESGSISTWAAGSTPEEFLAFPNLETLVLGDLSPSASASIEGVDDTETVALKTRRVMQDLQSAMEARAQAGRRLKRLEIQMTETDEIFETWIKKAKGMDWVGDIICRREGSQGGAHAAVSLDEISRNTEGDE